MMNKPITTNLQLKSLTPHIGAEVHGIDLSQPIDDATLAQLRAASAEWKVLVFRDQKLTREQHKTFGEKFGELHVHPMNKARNENAKGERYESDPAILPVKTTANSAYTAGDGWHTDVTSEQLVDGNAGRQYASVGLAADDGLAYMTFHEPGGGELALAIEEVA